MITLKWWLISFVEWLTDECVWALKLTIVQDSHLCKSSTSRKQESNPRNIIIFIIHLFIVDKITILLKID